MACSNSKISKLMLFSLILQWILTKCLINFSNLNIMTLEATHWCISSFRNNKEQCVIVDGVSCNVVCVISCVAQGTVF